MTMTEFCLLGFGVILPFGFFIGMAFNEWTRSRVEHKARVRAAADHQRVVCEAREREKEEQMAKLQRELISINAKLYNLFEELVDKKKIISNPKKK